MASERPVSGPFSTAMSSSDEALNTALPPRPTSQVQPQDTTAVVSAREGIISATTIGPATFSGSQQQGREQDNITSPSDVERGMGGYPSSTARPEVVPIVTTNQGLGSGLPLLSPNAQYGPGARPRSGHSAQSQFADPFAGSPDRSPARNSNANLPYNSRSQNGSPAASANEGLHSSPVGPSRDDPNDGYASRVRHVLEAERDNLVNRLTTTRPNVQPVPGSQIRHLFDNERDRLVERIPGAYYRDSQNVNDGPGPRLREALGEERENIIGHIPGGSHHGQPQGGAQNEGFGARLRHAAEDYFHDTFPSYHLPTIPGRIFHAPDGTRGSARNPQSVIDHVVPVHRVPGQGMDIEKAEITYAVGSVSARLSATLADAQSERDKYAEKAKITGLALNVAIGLQVLLGSLTTGLSAVATQGKSAAVSTTILGALSTVVASYLARARGSNEPELSITRVKDLEQFIRECKNFENDHGEDMTTAYDAEIERLRVRFESLLGNANGERKLSPIGGALTKS